MKLMIVHPAGEDFLWWYEKEAVISAVDDISRALEDVSFEKILIASYSEAADMFFSEQPSHVLIIGFFEFLQGGGTFPKEAPELYEHIRTLAEELRVNTRIVRCGICKILDEDYVQFPIFWDERAQEGFFKKLRQALLV